LVGGKLFVVPLRAAWLFFGVRGETVALRATNLCAGDASAAYFIFYFFPGADEFQTDDPRLPISTESDSDPQVNDRFDDWVTTSQITIFFFFSLNLQMILNQTFLLTLQPSHEWTP
jgi:hypothetical protein